MPSQHQTLDMFLDSDLCVRVLFLSFTLHFNLHFHSEQENKLGWSSYFCLYFCWWLDSLADLLVFYLHSGLATKDVESTGVVFVYIKNMSGFIT